MYALSFVLTLLQVLIAVLSILGLVWLTKFSFDAKKTSDPETYTISGFSNGKLNLCRFTTVLTWVQIALVCVVAIGAMTNSKR